MEQKKERLHTIHIASKPSLEKRLELWTASLERKIDTEAERQRERESKLYAAIFASVVIIQVVGKPEQHP